MAQGSMNQRKVYRRKARATLGWTLLVFVGMQLALTAAVERWKPELSDPEFALRLATFRKQQAAAPKRPVLLVVGSSRMAIGFQPEILPPLTTTSNQNPLVFNFSHLGAGPVLNLVEMHRLQRRGIHSDWVVLEVMPPFLAEEGTSILTTIPEVRDLPVLRDYIPAGKLYGRFLRCRLVTCYQRRMELCREFLPWLLPHNAGFGKFRIEALGGQAVELLKDRLSAYQISRRTAISQGTYSPPLQQFHIEPSADRALRRTIELGQRRGTRFALFVAPESSTFRSWYAPGAADQAIGYLRSIGAEYGIPVIDARTWLDDADFYDGHHVMRGGAERFTRRLAAEVLQPLVEGKLGETAKAER